jgi:hypothetical protein
MLAPRVAGPEQASNTALLGVQQAARTPDSAVDLGIPPGSTKSQITGKNAASGESRRSNARGGAQGQGSVT